MQRTEPPPRSSIVGTGTATIRSTQCRSVSRLSRIEAAQCPVRHGEHRRAVRCGEFQRIACERSHLRAIDGDDLAAAGPQPLEQRHPLRFGHSLGADDRAALPDREQHVRVIDGDALAVRCIEGERLVAKLFAELREHVGVRTRRQARVGDPACVIEHDTAGAFQEAPGQLVVAEVEQPRHGKAAPLLERDEQFHAALEPAARRQHRVEHDRPVVMQADPVVREHAVRARRAGRLVDRMNLDAGAAQCRDQRIELRHGHVPRAARRLPGPDAGSDCSPPSPDSSQTLSAGSSARHAHTG